MSIAVGGVSAFGGPVLLAGYVHGRGLDIERQLIRGWGGWPTTQMLRVGSPQLVDRRRSAVERVADMQLPPKDDVENSGYDAAISSVRAKTRDRSKYGLLFAENRNYGFERNLLGVKTVGLWVSAATLVAAGGVFVYMWTRESEFQPELLLGLLIISILGVGWWRVPSEERARTAGFKYAERLLEACETL